MNQKIVNQPIDRQDQIFFLQGLDSVGEIEAIQLLNVLKTPQAIIEAITQAEFRKNTKGKTCWYYWAAQYN